MKQLYSFLLIFLIFSCSNPDEDIKIEDQPIVEEPENPTPINKVKLPKRIEYVNFNFLDAIFYKSDNTYTYDNLNRISHIVINSSVNDNKTFDYEYYIIYKDTTALAKGFEIKTHNHQTSQITSEFIELEYLNSQNTNNNTSKDSVYYSYVNSLAEINDNTFIRFDSQFITGSFVENIFYPYNCGYSLFPNIRSSIIFVNKNGYSHVEYTDFGNWVQKGIKIGLPLTNDSKSSAFLDAKFDYVFWTFFLKDQIFQYETGKPLTSLTSYDFIDENLRTIIYKPDEQKNTYLDTKYPTFKKYNGKYWEQKNDLLSSYEYSVTY